ncbi:MAG TPA: glycosyltransferase [Candidatus Paceibacterota bacterium]|jgi:glycosyltransferase involved in cell wall biosynthesis
MKHVVVLINQLGIGGAERVAVDEVNELHRQGVQVTLITLARERETSYLADCRIPDERRVFLPHGSLYNLRSLLRLTLLLRKLDPDLLVTHLWFANTVGRVAARLANVPTIAFEHNVYDRVKTWKQFFVDRLLQGWCRKIAAVSEDVRNSLAARGIRKERIVVIDNGIDLARYSGAVPGSLRKEIGAAADETIFLFVGRLIEQKGVDVLLSAFAGVSNARLVLAGDGPDRTALVRQMEAAGIQEQVVFLGVRNDIPSLLKAADCLVLPSRWEGLGLVVPEALAAGLPVIVADFPAGKDMVGDGRAGLVVPREDVGALQDAMMRMCDSSFRKKIAACAPKAADRFSIHRHVAILLSYA